MHLLKRALVTSVIALAWSAGSATAQWSGFFFFGDSLTDAGSYQPVLPPGVGRFTTNPDLVWAQVLGARYGFTITPANQGGTDYAYGGARVTLTPGYPAQPPTNAAVPIATQVGQQLGRGIDPNAVYAVWGGANDIFVQLGLAQAGTITSAQLQAAVALAATQYVQQVAALQAAGAQNLVVLNLPDIGKTPAFLAAGPAAAAQVSAITGLYNGTVQAGLDALGGNLLRIDMYALFNEILANPAAFGFTNTTALACAGVPSSLLCSPANLVAPNANQSYVFADGVHPTGGAHAAIAGVIASILESPSQAATLTEGPMVVEQATFRTVDGRMWSALNTPVSQRPFNLWASYDFASSDIESGYARGDADTNTFSFGGDYRVNPNLLIGAAVNWSEYKASYTGGSHKLDETSATLYAGFGNGPWFFGASLLFGDLDYKDVRRNFNLGTVPSSSSGDTGGSHWAARLLGGYWFTNQRDFVHGPFAKLVYQEVDVDGFSEPATTMTALRFGEQTRESLIASVGWQVQGQVGAVRPFGRVTWEYEFKDDPLRVTVSPATIGGSFSASTPNRDDNWALFSFGASMDFGSASATKGPVSGYLMGTATAGKGDGDAYSVTIGVRVPL